MNPSVPIRVLIADRDLQVRERLSAALSSSPDFLVVGEAADGADALRIAAAQEADVSLVHDSMPTLGGLEVMQECRRRNLAARAILLTDDVEHADIVRLLRYGGRGIIGRDCAPEMLSRSVRHVHDGEVWIGRQAIAAVAAVLGAPVDFRLPSSSLLHLTRRELDVLRLVVEGESNGRIAARLSVESDTVKHHLTSIFNKTGMSNRLELALFAVHHGVNGDGE